MPYEMKEKYLDEVFTVKRKDSGLFISVVGFDGSGKTTQIEAIAEEYRKLGKEVIVTKEPTDWYRSQSLVRNYLENGGTEDVARIMALLVAADRVMHVKEEIIPALERGHVVICDRYVLATFAIMLHRGVDPQTIIETNKGVPRPDYSFYLDVPSAVLIERLYRRDGTKLKFEEQSEDRINSIVKSYTNMGKYIHIIDGNKKVELVTQDIKNILFGGKK